MELAVSTRFVVRSANTGGFGDVQQFTVKIAAKASR
jgi:hypothetical protein